MIAYPTDRTSACVVIDARRARADAATDTTPVNWYEVYVCVVVSRQRRRPWGSWSLLGPRVRSNHRMPDRVDVRNLPRFNRFHLAVRPADVFGRRGPCGVAGAHRL